MTVAQIFQFILQKLSLFFGILSRFTPEELKLTFATFTIASVALAIIIVLVVVAIIFIIYLAFGNAGIKKNQNAGIEKNQNASIIPAIDIQAVDVRVGESGINQKSPLLRIFMCYSSECFTSENRVKVKKLCENLRTDNYLPWLAEEELMPGHDRVLETENALSNSDIVLILLSAQSIEQSGHMQKEIKMALEISDTHPDGKVYIIPVLLEQCNVPSKYAKWQWANLFETNGYQRLLKSLALRSPRG